MFIRLKKWAPQDVESLFSGYGHRYRLAHRQIMDWRLKKIIVQQGPFLSSGGERLSNWYISSSESENGDKWLNLACLAGIPGGISWWCTVEKTGVGSSNGKKLKNRLLKRWNARWCQCCEKVENQPTRPLRWERRSRWLEYTGAIPMRFQRPRGIIASQSGIQG